MGNCNSIDPACATLQHPSGKVEKLGFSSSARQLMLQHPGHYVALLPPPLTPSADGSVVHVVKQKQKLLPPDTMLTIGSCYRLVSFEDVLLGLSDTGNMAHQTSRKATVGVSKDQEVQGCKQSTVQVSKAAAKRITQLRAMLSKSLLLQKDSTVLGDFPVPTAPAPTIQVSSNMVFSPIQPMCRMQRVGSWRPNLQSIAERGQ